MRSWRNLEQRRAPGPGMPLEFACREVGMKVMDLGAGDYRLTPLDETDERSATEIHVAAARRRHVDDAFLRDAVVTWREQERNPEAAARAFHISVSQLHRYLKKARERGIAPEYGTRKGSD